MHVARSRDEMLFDAVSCGVIPQDMLVASLPEDGYEKRRQFLAFIECMQEIPCDPCVDACPYGAISMEGLPGLPKVDPDMCIGCLKCLGICPGLAIFGIKPGMVAIPFEMLPVPEKVTPVELLDREGTIVGEGEVFSVIRGPTPVAVLRVPVGIEMEVRNFRIIPKQKKSEGGRLE